MKHLILLLVLSATGPAVHAAEDRSSLFACGINFGGKQLTFSVPTRTSSKKGYEVQNQRLLHVAGAVRTQTVRFIEPSTAESSKKEKRLPRKVTFATVGCSWR
jgi:hypothetical protein